MIEGTGDDDRIDLKKAHINFNQDTEIYDIRKCDENVKGAFQIIARDCKRNVLTILTWDFERNIELSIFQTLCSVNIRPERRVTKGMDEKFNYYIGEDEIIDLEYNVPLQKCALIADVTKVVEQPDCRIMKIYKDSTRTLGIDEPRCLKFPITRKDLVFWINVDKMLASPKTII